MEAVVIGYSGHAFVVIDTLLSLNHKIVGYCELEDKKNNPFKLSYFGSEANSNVLNRLKKLDIFLGLGDNRIRAKVYMHFMENDIICQSAVHKKACVSTTATIGKGTLIMPGAVINSMAKIGLGVVCNTASVIEHECKIGDFAHIAPGAVLLGDVTIGEKSFIGANAVIKQGLIIGKNVTIGAGSVVTKDIEDGLTFYGNPAREKNKL
jgi:sugar O-acyltransferase (sialic acid O-acetyltransferase NeuD family)